MLKVFCLPLHQPPLLQPVEHLYYNSSCGVLFRSGYLLRAANTLSRRSCSMREGPGLPTRGVRHNAGAYRFFCVETPCNFQEYVYTIEQWRLCSLLFSLPGQRRNANTKARKWQQMMTLAYNNMGLQAGGAAAVVQSPRSRVAHVHYITLSSCCFLVNLAEVGFYFWKWV